MTTYPITTFAMMLPFCLFTILIMCDAYNTFKCLDSCLCDTVQKVINCYSGTRVRLFIPETRLRGFNFIRATNNNIRELPSEDILLEKFPDLKVLDVEENMDFNCSSLEQYKRINLLSDCNKSSEQIDYRIYKAAEFQKHFDDIKSTFEKRISGLESLLKLNEDSKKRIEDLEKKLEESENKLNETREKLSEEIKKKQKKIRLDLSPWLVTAVKSRNLTEVGNLLDDGADANTVDEYGKSMLYLAVESRNERMEELLADKGADLDARDNIGWTPLHVAAEDGKDRIVSILIQKGADITSTTIHGVTPLHLAVVSHSLGTVRKMLTQPLDKYGEGGIAAYVNARNKWGITAFHSALKSGNGKMIKLLADKGADLDAKDDDGRTPLNLAAWKGWDWIVGILIELGADIKSTSRNYGRTPLHWAASSGSLDIVRTLLSLPLDKYGGGGKAAYVNAQDNDGSTALHMAYSMKKMGVAKILEENGADGTIKNKWGKTPKEM